MKKLIQIMAAWFSKTERRRQKVEKALNILRKVINNPALDLVTELTRNNIDNQILYALREVINTLFVELAPQYPNARLVANEEVKTEIVLSEIRKQTESEQEENLRRIGSELEAKIKV